jgi:signal transduction histidine kinase
MLTLALVATLIMSTGAMLATMWAVSESVEGSGALARREEQTAYVVGGVAVDIARGRAHLRDALTEAGPPAHRRVERARRVSEDLERAAQALPALLGPDEEAAWRAVEPRVLGMVARFDHAIAAIEAGDDARAEAVLDEGAAEAQTLSVDLDRFREISLEETAASVSSIQTRAEGTLRIASLAWLGIMGALAVVWVLILRVVAAQRRTLAAQMAALEAANRELDAFAGRVAHDMRNVLTPIQLGVDAMGAVSCEPRLRRVVDRIGRSCARGRSLVDGLLAFASGGGHASAGHPADLGKEVGDVLDQLRDAIRQADVQVTTRLPDVSSVALPSPLLHVVLVNVVGNAVKFLDGRTERRLAIRARRDHDHVRIDISDTGPGIPAAELPRVFDALYSGARSRGSGIGLGLATVKRIVESVHGHVEIRSVVDAGTTVTVVLPEATPKQSPRS